jgi:hypothetical protein
MGDGRSNGMGEEQWVGYTLASGKLFSKPGCCPTRIYSRPILLLSTELTRMTRLVGSHGADDEVFSIRKTCKRTGKAHLLT